MSASKVFSVRIFGGTYETDAYPTREQAEEHVRRSVAFAAENGLKQAAPVVVEVEVEGEPRLCSVCGEKVVTSSHPDVTYCKTCHYTGQGATAERVGQIARFESMVPGAKVGVEHTGGGCFWLAFTFEGEETFYALTDGEASLPEDEDGTRIEDGGWGYVGRHSDDESSEDYEGTELFYDPEALTEPGMGLSDAQAATAILADRMVGRHVALVHDTDRYPHFLAPAGSTGVVTWVEDETLAVRMDEHLPGAEEWDNEIHWYLRNGDRPGDDLRVISEQDALVARMAAAVEEALEDWRSGRNASPDERDYVLDALRILDATLDDAAIERVADGLYETACEGTVPGVPVGASEEEFKRAHAAYVIESVQAALVEKDAPPTVKAERQGIARAMEPVAVMIEAKVLPPVVAENVEEIAEDAMQAAFKVIADRLAGLGFPVSGDVMPGEAARLDSAFQGFVFGMALNSPEIGRLNEETD